MTDIENSMGAWRRAGVCAVLATVLLLWPGAANSERYQYDAAGRLTGVIFDDLSSLTYSYDANGNLLALVTTIPGVPGDADLDGDVDDDDVAAILQLILASGLPYSPTADCNGDDTISVLDLVCAINAKSGE